VLVVTVGEADQLIYKVGDAPEERADPVPLIDHKGNMISRYDLVFAQTEDSQRVEYFLAGDSDGGRWQFVIPASSRDRKSVV
jgi:hypothetical protein